MSSLQPISPPFHLSFVLASLVALGFASLFYEWKCPDVVKHETRHESWVIRSKPLLEYEGASHDLIRWRSACSALYLLGTYSVAYFLWRIAKSIWILVDAGSSG